MWNAAEPQCRVGTLYKAGGEGQGDSLKGKREGLRWRGEAECRSGGRKGWMEIREFGSQGTQRRWCELWPVPSHWAGTMASGRSSYPTGSLNLISL